MEYRKLIAAASVRSAGTDTLEGLNSISDDIERRYQQVLAGLLSPKEAINLVRAG